MEQLSSASRADPLTLRRVAARCLAEPPTHVSASFEGSPDTYVFVVWGEGYGTSGAMISTESREEAERLAAALLDPIACLALANAGAESPAGGLSRHADRDPGG